MPDVLRPELRPAVPEDAGAWVETHLTSLGRTYPGMPREFVASRRRRQPELVEQTAADIAAADGVDDRWEVALLDGELVGLGHVCRGAQEWERRLLRRYPDPALGLRRGLDDRRLRQLTTLYTSAAVHGGGVGAALFDRLVGDDPCYLWIMTGNPRAETFYRRRGFDRGSVNVPSGPTWSGWPMFQLVR